MLLLHSSSLARSKRNDTTCTSNLPGIEPLCRTRKIMLLHFSKCSGTWLCQLAQQAGCSTWHNHSAAQLWKPQNCALRTTAFQDGPWWIPKEHAPHAWHRANFAYQAHAAAGRGRVSCAVRLQRAPDFHAVESALPGGEPRPGPGCLAGSALARAANCTGDCALPWVCARQPLLPSPWSAGGACPGFFTMAVLRPPVERLYSHAMEIARWGMVRRRHCQRL